MNELYPIDKDMKFVKEGRAIRPWREFRKAFREVGMGREWYKEARIGEQPYSIEFMKQNALDIKATRKEMPEPGFFERIWNWIKSLFSGN